MNAPASFAHVQEADGCHRQLTAFRSVRQATVGQSRVKPSVDFMKLVARTSAPMASDRNT